MNTFKYGLLAQGIGLPKFSQTATVLDVAGLDTQRHGWRIRHPQAMTELGQYISIPPISSTRLGVNLFLFSLIGSQRKRPHCACLARHCLAATRSAIASLSYGAIPMIYTFCITRSRGPIAALTAIRTVSVYATTESEARTRLAGLPLVFLSRSPATEVAA